MGSVERKLSEVSPRRSIGDSSAFTRVRGVAGLRAEARRESSFPESSTVALRPKDSQSLRGLRLPVPQLKLRADAHAGGRREPSWTKRVVIALPDGSRVFATYTRLGRTRGGVSVLAHAADAKH